MRQTQACIGAAIAVVIIAILWSIHSLTKPQQQPEGKISGAYEALNWWSLQRAYPNAAIPEVAQYAAFEYAHNRFPRSLHKTGSEDQWQEIGPHNLGGRTLAIALNPQNSKAIYAGSASGGLWRSFTAGVGAKAWERVATGFPVLAVSSIAFAPGDSMNLYIGTGEVYNYQNAGTGAAYRNTRGSYGIGILKTADGGATWHKSLDWSFNQRRGVWAIKVNPFNANTLWAATTEGTYKSTDAGSSWQQVHNVVMANDLVISPVDTNIIIVGCGNFASSGHGLYRTSNSGDNWEKIELGLPSTFRGKIQLAQAPSAPEKIYASIGDGFSTTEGASWLCSSFDNGASWGIQTQQDYSRWQGWYSHDIAVNPTNSEELFAIGIDIHKSTNGGLSIPQVSNGNWFSGRVEPGDPEGSPTYSHSDHHDVVWHPTDPRIIYFANDGGVNHTTDGGRTFRALNGGYQTSQFYNGFSSSQTDSLLAIGGFQDNSTAVYDGRLGWFVHLIGGDGGWAAIDPTDENIMYGSWQFLNLLKSTNGGQSFFGIPVPGSVGPTSFIAPFVVAPSNPQILYAGRDIVYKSANGGSNWSATNNGAALDGNPVLAMTVSHQSELVVYATTAPFANRPGVFRSLNGGASWNNISSTLPNRFPMDVAVDPTNDAVVYVTFSGFGSSHVFKSTTFGQSWENIGAELPDVPTNAVVVDPDFPDHVYVGNDLGVYASIDGGATWRDFNEGVIDAVMVFDLSVSPLNRKLRIATHGNGAFERSLLEGVPSSVEHEAQSPAAFSLEQNYPNPFNPTTTIAYTLPLPAAVTLKVFNSLGQEVRTLVDAQPRIAGQHTVLWDGTNSLGEPVAAGAYLYELRSGSIVQSKRMTLIK